MPFIDSKLTVELTEEKKEKIKQKLGKAVSLLHKSETYLMVGFEGGVVFVGGGRERGKGA